ncbi:MAG: deoxyribodipyrimidine photolyase [Planctomycetes bacterium]|nr:deoxyribodipyrimidine photolyase [Planctomycetota bacterium]
MTSLTHLLAEPRQLLSRELGRVLPESAVGPGRGSVPDGTHVGGRAAGLSRLAAMDPLAYGQTRNHVAGAVTGLSPWIRHGVLSISEVRDAALARVSDAAQAAKLVSELGWRDYWRQVHLAVGDGILEDLEAPAARGRRSPLGLVPDDVREARTGMACIDAFVRRLHGTGWLHNHERMWLASWLVHVRGVHWRAGADWFLEHLLDGDPASNHLSWQWVAGTFSAKPYLFNRENLETYTSGSHCRACPEFGRCDVEGGYDDLATRLFAESGRPVERPPLRIRPGAAPSPAPSLSPALRRPLVWLTIDSASATSPAATAFPDAPRLFVLDPAWLAAERPSVKRLVFLCECLADVPGIEVFLGDPHAVVPVHAAALGCDGVAVAETPCPRIRRGIASIQSTTPVAVMPWPPFCDRSRVRDLGRFSRYWQHVSTSALRPTAS